MKTFSINALAEQLEIDRGTMVKALKNTPPDAEQTPGRPTFKISTAANALEVHRRKTGNRPNGSGTDDRGRNDIDPRMAALYAQAEKADKAMRKLPTVAQRRAAVIKTIMPIVIETQRMQMVVAASNGQDLELIGSVSDQLYMLALRGFEEPCKWTMEQTWAAVNV